MAFTVPAGTVAYEEDHARASQLAGGRLAGPGWTTLSARDGAVAGYFALFPDCWEHQFCNPEIDYVLFPPSHNYLFLHARRSAGGQDRLVYAAVNNIFALRQGSSDPLAPGWPQQRMAIDWIVIRPGTFRSAPATLARGSWGDGNFWINMPHPLRLYAGQPSATDPSRFTIPYRMPDGPFALDVRLLKDDTLSFSRRSATPADAPMP